MSPECCLLMVFLIATLVLMILMYYYYQHQHDDSSDKSWSMCEVRSPPILASRNWLLDGPQRWGDYLYLMVPTEVKLLHWLKEPPTRAGIVWVRLSTTVDYWQQHTKIDLEHFTNHWLPILTAPIVLITTDGDTSVPSELKPHITSSILQHPHIKAWYTQNYDGTLKHPKLHPIPIGIDAQWRWSQGKTPWSRYHAITNARRRHQCDTRERRFRIWCDLHFKGYPGRHGDPRAILKKHLYELPLVRTPTHRLTEEQVWDKYSSYAMVLSLHGKGLDCHRTWEALYLGAVVVTQHSSLDSLLEPWRVIFFEDIHQLKDEVWLYTQWQQAVCKPRHDLQRSVWLQEMQEVLTVPQ